MQVAVSISGWLSNNEQTVNYEIRRHDDVTVEEDRDIMAQKRPAKKQRFVPKTVLRLPDLDQAKAAVLHSLSSADCPSRKSRITAKSVS
jgi:hypothetical protein